MANKLNWHVLLLPDCIRRKEIFLLVFVVFCVCVVAGIGLTATSDGTSSVTEASSSQHTKYEDHTETFLSQENVEYNNSSCNCTHTSEEYEIRKHIEEMIRAAVRDILDQAPGTGALTGYDVTGDIRDTADILLKQLSINIKQITEKIQYTMQEKQLLKTIENLKNRVVELNNKSSETCNIVKLLNATGSVNDSSIVNSMCDVTPPSSVLVSDVIWKKYKKPAEDDLDRYMVNKTGCSYHVLDQFTGYTPAEVPYDGKQWEWRGAVRARDGSGISIYWGHGDGGYAFTVGDEDNTVTKIFSYNTSKEWTQSTPGIVSPDRYIPFYIKMREGKLTFGSECEREPIVNLDVTIERGQEVGMFFTSSSWYGSKFLHCPANVAVVDVELVELLRSYDTRAARLGSEDKSTRLQGQVNSAARTGQLGSEDKSTRLPGQVITLARINQLGFK